MMMDGGKRNESIQDLFIVNGKAIEADCRSDTWTSGLRCRNEAWDWTKCSRQVLRLS